MEPKKESKPERTSQRAQCNAVPILQVPNRVIQIIVTAARRRKVIGWRRYARRTVFSTIETHGWVLLTALLVLPGVRGNSRGAVAVVRANAIEASPAATDGIGNMQQQEAPKTGGSGEAGRKADRAGSIHSGGDYVLEPT